MEGEVPAEPSFMFHHESWFDSHPSPSTLPRGRLSLTTPSLQRGKSRGEGSASFNYPGARLLPALPG